MIGSVNPAPVSVLVIENHPMMREALCHTILEEPDLTIVEPGVKDGGTLQLSIATKSELILLTCKPDIILVALGNPGTDDLETLSILQKNLSGTPILVLTSNEVAGQEQAALEAGASAVLTKAVSRVELIGKLRELKTKTAMNR